MLDLGLTGLTVVNEGLPFFNPSAILAGDAHANPGNVPRDELTATPLAGTPADISHDAGRVGVRVEYRHPPVVVLVPLRWFDDVAPLAHYCT